MGKKSIKLPTATGPEKAAATKAVKIFVSPYATIDSATPTTLGIEIIRLLTRRRKREYTPSIVKVAKMPDARLITKNNTDCSKLPTKLWFSPKKVKNTINIKLKMVFIKRDVLEFVKNKASNPANANGEK